MRDAAKFVVGDRIRWTKGTHDDPGVVTGHGPRPQTSRPLVRVRLDDGSEFLTYADDLKREAPL